MATLGRVTGEHPVARFSRFGVVGASGVVVNSAALALLVSGLGVHYLAGVVLATQCSTLWNFALVERWALRDDSARGLALVRFLQFAAVNNAALLARGPLVVLLSRRLGVHYLLANLASLVLLLVGRFLVADRWIWRRTVPGAT